MVQKKDLLDSISEKAKAAMVKSPLERPAKLGASEQYHIFHQAPTVIVVSGAKNVKAPIELPDQVWKSYSPLADCAAAIQNMLLAAESIGVASCWIGYVNYYFMLAEAEADLGLPAEYSPLFAVCLGYKTASLNGTGAVVRKLPGIQYIR